MSLHDLPLITDVCAQQHGVIHRHQALDAGITNRQWDHWHEHGILAGVDYRVSRLCGGATDPLQAIFAATLASGGVASHRSAARLHGLSNAKECEVIVDRNRRYRKGLAIAHRSLDLVESDCSTVDGIPCTNVRRTLLDVGAVVGSGTLEIMVDQALNRHLVTMPELTTRFLQVARQGRRGVGQLRPILAERDPSFAPTESALETLVLRILREHLLPTPTPQFEVRLQGHRYRIDLAYPDLMIAIEIDGRVHNEGPQFDRDRKRQNALVIDGWLVLRFTYSDVTRHPATVADCVHEAITQRSIAA